ncbi:MAG: DMT family transporter [Anaerolineae bacterium]|nr:DMT family transporter [Thermoflexales bacterium]MDW8407801.1 DMT family transporter [Anaerolineae bacterium]
MKPNNEASLASAGSIARPPAARMPVASQPAAHPLIGLALGVVAVSTASLFVRFAQQAGADSLAIAALRLCIASLVIAPAAWQRCRDELRQLSRRDLAIGLSSGAFLGLHFATWITSLQYTSVASSVVLVTLSPMFVALGSALFLRERLPGSVIFAMGIATVGGIVIAVGDQALVGTPDLSRGNSALGNVLALAGAVSIAPHFIIGRRLRARLSLLAYISVVYGAAAILLLIAVAVLRVPLLGFEPQAYLWVTLLALLPQLVGHTSFNWALAYLPATYATIPVLGEPIGSTVLAVVVLREPLTLGRALGALLVLLGIGLMAAVRARRSHLSESRSS